MSQFDQIVRLSPQTVGRISTQEVTPMTETRERTRRSLNDLSVTKVHPAVWTKALELAGGNRRRIRVVSATEVVVQNQATS